MPAPSPLALFLDPLERLGLPYCITGSVAASVYGEPRLTADRAAEYVHRILQGVKPATLPLERASSFKLVLNVQAAKALGLKIPESVRARVDEAIQ